MLQTGVRSQAQVSESRLPAPSLRRCLITRKHEQNVVVLCRLFCSPLFEGFLLSQLFLRDGGGLSYISVHYCVVVIFSPIFMRSVLLAHENSIAATYHGVPETEGPYLTYKLGPPSCFPGWRECSGRGKQPSAT